MLDIDYLSGVNNPDGLHGLYVQVPCKYRRATQVSDHPAGNVVVNYEMPWHLGAHGDQKL
eukprot:6213391-Pleurochrysis_carterae.AAC.1